MIMLIYLQNARHSRVEAGRTDSPALLESIREGAVLRVRPKVMTVAVIIAGLLLILWGDGAGSEIMKRIAAPMIGGMITAPLLSIPVLPAAWLMRRKGGERDVAGLGMTRGNWRESLSRPESFHIFSY